MTQPAVIDYGAVFRAMPYPALIMDVDLRIVDANPSYLEATHRDMGDLVGRDMFEAFPENPERPDGGEGVANLRSSLHTVLTTGKPHNMWVQRYDVPWDEPPGEFVERYWSPINSPIVDGDGELVGILHVVEDVTGFHDDLAAALEFYRAEVRSPSGDDDETRRRFATYAQVAMSNSRVYMDVAAEVEQLRAALTSRATIEQAKGIVMAQHGCSAEAAFTLLAKGSQVQNIKVRDLAATLISSVVSEER